MCDDRSMAVAPRVKPQDLFTPDEWTQEKITRAAFSGYLDRNESTHPRL